MILRGWCANDSAAVAGEPKADEAIFLFCYAWNIGLRQGHRRGV